MTATQLALLRDHSTRGLSAAFAGLASVALVLICQFVSILVVT